MTFVDKIIARLAGFDPQEIEATFARTQSGHAAMPDPKANLQGERAKVHQEVNLGHEKEQRREHHEFHPGEEVHPITPEVSLDKEEAREV
jgi:hypothetical protein